MVDDERLQSILNAMEVPDMGMPERLFLQRILGRHDALHRFDPKRFPAEKGEEQVTWLIRAVFESSNGAPALTAFHFAGRVVVPPSGVAQSRDGVFGSLRSRRPARPPGPAARPRH